MYCPKCGYKYEDSFRFCVNCNTPNPYQSNQQTVQQKQQQSLDSLVIGDKNLYSVLVGGGLGLSGLLIFFSTFMAWLSLGGMGGLSSSGWDTIMHSSARDFGSQNPFFVSSEGFGLFGGAWPIIFGVAIMIGVVLFFKEKRSSTTIFTVVGIFGFVFALSNIIMIYSKLGSGDSEYGAFISVGMGLWIFLFFSLIVAVLGILSSKYNGVYW